MSRRGGKPEALPTPQTTRGTGAPPVRLWTWHARHPGGRVRARIRRANEVSRAALPKQFGRQRRQIERPS